MKKIYPSRIGTRTVEFKFPDWRITNVWLLLTVDTCTDTSATFGLGSAANLFAESQFQFQYAEKIHIHSYVRDQVHRSPTWKTREGALKGYGATAPLAGQKFAMLLEDLVPVFQTDINTDHSSLKLVLNSQVEALVGTGGGTFTLSNVYLMCNIIPWGSPNSEIIGRYKAISRISSTRSVTIDFQQERILNAKSVIIHSRLEPSSTSSDSLEMDEPTTTHISIGGQKYPDLPADSVENQIISREYTGLIKYRMHAPVDQWVSPKVYLEFSTDALRQHTIFVEY